MTDADDERNVVMSQSHVHVAEPRCRNTRFTTPLALTKLAKGMKGINELTTIPAAGSHKLRPACQIELSNQPLKQVIATSL